MLHPTHRHTRAADYRRRHGPWDVPPLDRALLPVDGVDEVAGGLRAAGVKRGDVVAWQKPNVVDALLLYRACWRLGAFNLP